MATSDADPVDDHRGLVALRDGVRGRQVGVDQRLGETGGVVGVGQGIHDRPTELPTEAKRLVDLARGGGAEAVPSAAGRQVVAVPVRQPAQQAGAPCQRGARTRARRRVYVLGDEQVPMVTDGHYRIATRASFGGEPRARQRLQHVRGGVNRLARDAGTEGAGDEIGLCTISV
jgi:hypothetical protein